MGLHAALGTAGGDQMSTPCAAAGIVQPCQYVGQACKLPASGQGWPHHHHDRQAECAGGIELGLCTAATCVFRHDYVHAVLLQQSSIVRYAERATRDNGGVLGQRGRRIGRINQPQDVVVLRLRGKDGEMLSAHSQQHPLGSTSERGSRRWQIGYRLPAVPVARLPSVSGKRQQRNPNSLARCNRIATHARSEGMCSVHHMGHTMALQVMCKAVNAAEAANAHSNGLRCGLSNPPGIRQCGALAPLGQGTRKCTRLGGAAQHQDIAYG